MKIKEMGLDEEKQKLQKEMIGSSNYNDETNWPWWRLVNELKGLDGMLERFQKENEKLMVDKRAWEWEVKEL